MGDGHGDDLAEQIQVNEATDADVADEVNVAEENQEDAQYDELYGDPNIGVDFAKSLNTNDAIVVKNTEEKTETTIVASEVSKASVAYEGKVAEENLDDYDELYGDLNLGVVFCKSLNRGGDAAAEEENKTDASSGNAASKPRGFENQGVKPDGGLKTELRKVDKKMSGLAHAVGGGCTRLFVKDLEWWTTDAELEEELRKYGVVKALNFIAFADDGMSMGCCEVEFHDPIAAAACQQGMNGHVFNGKPCAVQFGSRDYSLLNTMYNARYKKQGRPGQPPMQEPNDAAGSAIRGTYRYEGGHGTTEIANWSENAFSHDTSGNPRTTKMNMNPQGMIAPGFSHMPMGRPMAPYSGYINPIPPVGGMYPRFLNPFLPVAAGWGMPSVAPQGNQAFFGRGMPDNLGRPNVGVRQGPIEKDRGSAGRDLTDSKRGKQHREENEHDRYTDRTRDRREHSRERKHYTSDREHSRDVKHSRDREERERKHYTSDREHSRDVKHLRERGRKHYKKGRDKCADRYRRRYRSPEDDDDDKRKRVSSLRSPSKSKFNDDRQSRSRH